jgi:hypothetical protein
MHRPFLLQGTVAPFSLLLGLLVICTITHGFFVPYLPSSSLSSSASGKPGYRSQQLSFAALVHLLESRVLPSRSCLKASISYGCFGKNVVYGCTTTVCPSIPEV